MRSRFDEVVALTCRVTPQSNLTAAVLTDTSLVIERAADVLVAAQRLQVKLTHDSNMVDHGCSRRWRTSCWTGPGRRR